MEEAPLGVQLTEIPYKTRLRKSLTMFIPVTLLVILWVYALVVGEDKDSSYWFPFIVFCIGAWLSWAEFTHKVERKYDGMWVESVDKKGRKTRTLTYTPNGAAAKAFDEEIALNQPDKVSDFFETTLGRYVLAVCLGLLAV